MTRRTIESFEPTDDGYVMTIRVTGVQDDDIGVYRASLYDLAFKEWRRPPKGDAGKNRFFGRFIDRYNYLAARMPK